MPKNKIHILSTKPLGKEIVNEASRNDIIIDEVSFIKTEEIIAPNIRERVIELSRQSIFVTFTSINAVNAVNKLLKEKTDWKIFCIGFQTKKLVEQFFGTESIFGTANYAAQLAEKIIENPSIKKIVLFTGNLRRDELPDKIKTHGIELEELIVYKTVETPYAISKIYDGILFFSPSAVKSFFSINSITNSTKLFAIGNATANEINHFTKQTVIVSEIPEKGNLVKLAKEHFK